MSVEIVPKPPQEIVDAIRDYIRSHRGLNELGVYLHQEYEPTDPGYIPYVPDTDAVPLMCWRNVRRRADLNDGLAVYGWAIWESEHVCLYPDSTILFMADPRIGYETRQNCQGRRQSSSVMTRSPTMAGVSPGRNRGTMGT